MSTYKVTVELKEVRRKVIEVDAVNKYHAAAKAKLQASDIDFNEEYTNSEVCVCDVVCDQKRRIKGVLWTVMPHLKSPKGWGWSGQKRLADGFNVGEDDCLFDLMLSHITNVRKAAYAASQLKLKYVDAGVLFIDPSDDDKPVYFLDLANPEHKTWKEWWRHITCHACEQGESMPADEQRWHSQTFKYMSSLGGTAEKGALEGLEGHAVYQCPTCAGYVVCDLVEETVDKNGIIED